MHNVETCVSSQIIYFTNNMFHHCTCANGVRLAHSVSHCSILKNIQELCSGVQSVTLVVAGESQRPSQVSSRVSGKGRQELHCDCATLVLARVFVDGTQLLSLRIAVLIMWCGRLKWNLIGMLTRTASTFWVSEFRSQSIKVKVGSQFRLAIWLVDGLVW